MDEFEVKRILIGYLKSKHDQPLFASEMPFANRSRRADLVVLTKNQLIGIEVKSDFDNFSRLDGQLDAYERAFERTYLALTERQFNKLNLKHDTIGILLIKADRSVILKKRPKVSRNFDLAFQLDLLSNENLKKIPVTNSSKLSKPQRVQALIDSYSATTLSKVAKSVLGMHLKVLNELFHRELAETGEITTDELAILEMREVNVRF
ncbi:hypothetical protein CWE15_04385 [Aliidiomarina taiwanensis]|uniref:Sce7726 family protein n=1 Tax=Aliidiomarina taiwanensis TaxID=946228 RepID=A0A432X757_9GAMM|nr:sce7726 family protein [Aliidiomarina taiwanensis]RUO42656.1 hypothetical protein CWE15_04385 [Aliidiomarina taiwanensis]